MTVGGHTDHALDLCGEDSADGKRQCLGKGQTMLTKPPVVDDPLFRKVLVTTTRMGQSAVCMGKGTPLGKRDTTLTHRDTFSRKIIPATDKRLDEKDMSRLNPRMKKVGGTLMSIYNVISVLNSNMDMYQYIFRATSPSLCLSYTYTGIHGQRYRVHICH